jgi:hypothetical protein
MVPLQLHAACCASTAASAHIRLHPLDAHLFPARLPGRRPKTLGIGLQEVGVKLGQNGAIEVRTGPL